MSVNPNWYLSDNGKVNERSWGMIGNVNIKPVSFYATLGTRLNFPVQTKKKRPNQ